MAICSPKNVGFLDDYASEPSVPDSYLVPNASARVRKALLDGNFARRSHPALLSEYVIWDTELAGLGLRVRPSGSAFWTVRLRHRGKQRRVTLGRVEDVEGRRT